MKGFFQAEDYLRVILFGVCESINQSIIFLYRSPGIIRNWDRRGSTMDMVLPWHEANLGFDTQHHELFPEPYQE